jgi:LacI family transcriptional regulator
MVQNRRARVNMANVARESGVSLSTVSMVFSDKPGLPAETRQRVLNTARILGYNPRRISTSGPTGTLRTVGLLVKSQFNEIPRSDQFYSLVLSGIEAACRARGLSLMYATMSTDVYNHPLEIPALMENGGADGLLLVGVLIDADLAKMLNQRGTPVILVDSYSEGMDFDCVVSDNQAGTYQATQYLIDNGHRKIGFLGGSEDAFPSFAERRRGYLKAMQDNQICETHIADCLSRREDAIEAARALLLAHPDLTALVGVNDFVAITAMHVAKELGRHVGEDLSLIGYDDILLSESVIPPLTTMQVDKHIMGQMAVQLLANRVEQPDSGRVTITIHPGLVERHSVRPAEGVVSYSPNNVILPVSS